jgi:Zn-dependent peptidase ImmA (M78 family)/transcriptional regulator with XRE-family HTH domain
MDNLTQLIGERIGIARDSSGYSQEALAKVLGFKDRQTVSSIELGQRKVSPEELVHVAKVLQKPLDYFTDPYVVAEKNQFSYRTTSRSKDVLEAFEHQAERLISASRRFRKLLGETATPVQPQLSSITKGMPFDFVAYQGEQTAAAWSLGDVPALRLREMAESKLGISILFVDAPDTVSGAACHLRDGGVILINRNEAPCRLNFSMGHEIFHLLTWDKMPPERLDLEDDVSHSRSKVEMLADTYTGGLLMPKSVIEVRWKNRGNQALDLWIRTHAQELRVSSKALYWRLVNLEFISKEDISVKALKPAGSVKGESRPNLYNRSFVERLHKVLSEGYITVLKSTDLLDCTIDDLRALFESYKLPVPFAL